jgi:hypothetical protein
MQNKSEILAAVVAFVNNSKASAQTEAIWTAARDMVRGDVFGIDTTATDWDQVHAEAHPGLWFCACLPFAFTWAQDEAQQTVAQKAYGAAVLSANSFGGQGLAPGQVQPQ